MKMFTKIHQTSKRIRYKCQHINSKTDVDKLIIRLESLNGVSSAKINIYTNSFTLYSKDGLWETKRLEEDLENINFNSFLCKHKAPKSKLNKNNCDTVRLWRSTAGLVATTLVPDKTSKLLISSLSTAPLIFEGMNELLSKGLTSKVLEAMAVGVSLARADYIAANSTNAMLELGEYIEETTVQKSDDLVKELSKPNVDKVWVEKIIDGKKTLKQVSTVDIKIGDIVVAGTGETIAIDGHIVEGSASINQVSMTGEVEPVKKERGDKIMSGVIVEDGSIKIWAESVGDNTATARIKNYILSSLEEKSNIGLKATKLADSLVPVTLALALGSYAVTQNTERLASVLQADYSCALKLPTPVTFKSAIAQAGKNGILIKGAKVLEALSVADTYVFDKTGTLTTGNLEVTDIISFDEKWSKEDILNLTASTEEHYFHPVAEAVVKAAKERGFIHMHHESVEFIVAHGVKTIFNDKEVVIGSRHFLEDDEMIEFNTNSEKLILKSLEAGKTILYVGYDKKLLGIIEMFDSLRDEAREIILKLKELGAKEIVMLTGDISSRAKAIADEIGIDRVYSDMLPDQKADVISQLKDEGKQVVFIGDGINDAPAIMNSNVGISMYKGADIAKATADVSLMRDDIGSLIELKSLANKTMQKIDFNFNTTVGINSVILFGAATGIFSPITTAVLHNGTTIGLLINSLRKINFK